jgi:hypothetical protein
VFIVVFIGDSFAHRRATVRFSAYSRFASPHFSDAKCLVKNSWFSDSRPAIRSCSAAVVENQSEIAISVIKAAHRSQK